MIDYQLFGSKRLYKLGKEIASGGEGKIYTIIGDNAFLIKIYNQTTKDLESKIKYMSLNPPSSDVLYDIAWPTDVLYDENDIFVGFVMPKLLVDTELKELYKYNPNEKNSLNYENKIVIGINLCKVISEVHKAGYIFGDFNPQNIGVNLINGHVGFFDADSYHVYDQNSNVWYKCGVGFDGYIAPELIKKASGKTYLDCQLPTFTKETDNFALAIHIFKLLFNGFTPFNGIDENSNVSTASPGLGNKAIERDNYCFKPGNKPLSAATPSIDAFPKYIVDLFNRAFIDGKSNPKNRPSADEWCEILIKYRSECVKCVNDETHFYYYNKKESKNSCPYCAANHRALIAQGYSTASKPIEVPTSNNKKSKIKYNKKIRFVENVFQYVALALPIFFALLFGIILFSNKEQIEIRANFSGWCTGWVFYSIIATIVSIVCLIKKKNNWRVDELVSRITSIIVGVLSSIFLIIVIINASKLTFGFYPPKYISIEVVGKTNSVRGSYNISKIDFVVANSADFDISYIYGDMILYNGNTKVGKYNVSFNGNYESSSSHKVYVEFSEYNSSSLYNTTFTNLGITFNISKLRFNGDYKEYNYDYFTVLKEIGDSSSLENNYQYAISLFNNGDYLLAKEIFKSLDDYKDSYNYVVLCDDKYYKKELENNLHNIAGNSAVLPDNYEIYLSYSTNSSIYYNNVYYDSVFSCDLLVNSSNYIEEFNNKLLNLGFTKVEENTYKKGLTIIKITDPIDGYSSRYIDYYAWKIN